MKGLAHGWRIRGVKALRPDPPRLVPGAGAAALALGGAGARFAHVAVAQVAAGGTVRQRAQIQQGIPTEKAKEVVKFIKDSKTKVQASIQGDVVRVSGRDRDTLQDVIARLKDKDFGIHMQFTNYRSN